MKRFPPFFVTFALLISFSFSAHSQSARSAATRLASHSMVLPGGELGNGYVGNAENVWKPGGLLNPSVLIPGADSLPISGHLQQQQSDGRALHCIQVDPSNPKNVHAVIMELSSADPADSNLLSRRCYYTFSSDGGHTWKAPIALTDVKTGFPCMILYQRNGKYVPIIAAHRFMTPLLSDTASSPYECALWVEKGAPGDGNFEMTECGTTGTYGTLQPNSAGILWPYIAISPDGSTVYMVGSVSYTDATASDYIKFGTFSLDATGHATWNGWNAQIGDNNGSWDGAGLVQSGDYVLRVSPKGKLGLLWRSSNYTDPAPNLYFIESVDGGKTWPQNFDPIEQITDLGQANSQGEEIYAGPWTGMDFFYDGENAKVLWSEAQEAFNLDTNVYYPSAMSLHLYDVKTGNGYGIVSNGATGQGDSIQYELQGNLMPYPVGTNISETDDWFDYPTIASANGQPNTFAVFYQTFQAEDSVTINPTTVKLYGSIYEQVTNDGGATWSAPTPYRANTAPGETFGKIDYRWPQTSDWNGFTNGIFSPTVMYGADTAAGSNAKNGTPDWDVIYFFHDTAMVSGALEGVSGQSGFVAGLSLQNYPNPVTASTEINFSVPRSSSVLLTVSDMLGRTVTTLVSGIVGPGQHSVSFNAGNLPNGVYRYTLEADGGSVSKSMSIMR